MLKIFSWFRPKVTDMSQALSDLQNAVANILAVAKQKDDEIASLKAQLADSSADNAMAAMTQEINAYAPPAPQSPTMDPQSNG